VSPRAVVFDLWETLIRWPREESRVLRERWSERLGVSAERMEELWYEAGAYERRESGPLLPFLREICAAAGSDAAPDEVLAWRVELARKALVPEADTVDALEELRRRGYLLGVISNCTEDVAIVWPETALRPLFDVAVFSSTAGCMKPDPRIYRLVCAELGVDAAECLFVGDGANDELAGAQRIGMTPVLIHRPGEDPEWDGLREWPGLRVTSISEVLELLS
jgi:putative hydrolase of the HAD superfamily